MRVNTLAIVLCAAVSLSNMAFAHERGAIIVRGGVMYYDMDSNSSKINYSGSSTAPSANIAGSGASIDSGGQLFNLSATWMVLPHFGLELMAGGGYRHTIKAHWHTTQTEYSGKLAEVSQQPLTASAQFFFLPSKSRFQPYAGLGLNYTTFYDERFSHWYRDQGYRKIEAKDSWGLSAQLGADFMITRNWLINASVSKTDASTTVRGKNRRTGERIKFDLDFDPWFYFLGVGYKF